MKISGLRLAQGEALPWWGGVAYYSPYSDHLIYYPVPFNWLVRWGRDIGWFLRKGKKDALAKAYEAGYEAGIGEHREAVETINRMVKNADN